MIGFITSKEVQQYLKENEFADEAVLLLKHKTILGLPSSVIVDQLRGRRKIKEKLPTYFNSRGIVYPPTFNLEQSSSEATAKFKSEVLSKLCGGNPARCADLTGGFGVDTFFLSKVFKQVHFIEPDSSLLKIAKHNHERLGAKNILYHNTSAETFIKNTTELFDIIFLDPSRRDRSKKKVFRFVDCEPNVLSLLDQVFIKAKYLVVKSSSLIDLQQGVLELHNVDSVFVVSLDNECKEVLFQCSPHANNKPTIQAINIQKGIHQVFQFTRDEERNIQSNFSEPLLYLFEPNASILKAGAFKLIGLKFGLFKIHMNTHLYTSNELNIDFPGRIFKVIATVSPDPKKLKPYFVEGKANVITRNYPMEAEALKKKSALKDGGEKYLIGFSSTKKRMVVVADRIA